ncbi:efflux RND transporter permease subunit [Novosphingobium album (ex Liu et al. 2023)]|uniref:Efflux pump membrane transporter n=1 Tax=Novosphingobium album (ex Liu et al. 2023) TaxID=3031130 RepID=A0ABT5WUC4_9SPHN|nr:efflux RND transporter permease subunit [Novosphingobium album (ex Liu et al. 2023)]MDE8653453.1 efflux RND transporter permease subunit [Novosphingobium album (ex Liu et al. 2023)]
MSRIFIDRPIFAWVIAIIVMLAGLGALTALPNEQYPDIAPTQVNIRAAYPGASASTIENSVTQILEQQLTGIDGLLYFSSQSSSRGRADITVTFAKGTDPDIAQVQVQNKIAASISRLPQAVQDQGVRVVKSNPDSLLMVIVYDETDTRSNQDVSDYLASNIQDPLSRVTGVGDVNIFGAPHAMRIWLDPRRLAAVNLMPSDVISALRTQNTEVAAGEVGGLPAPAGQMLNATLTAGSRLQTPEQFERIVLRTEPDGSSVTIKDVARVEIGAESYSVTSRVNQHPAAGISISLSPGADALETAELVKAKMAELSHGMPDGLAYTYGNDSTEFIKLSIEEVTQALLEAIVLVVIVMFVFLQSWRATLIPAIAVPVVLLGTFAVFYIAGFSINTLTMFGLVLAIGLLVDDAIVVVENVERLMEENPGMTPREATIQSMQEIQVALIAIALVLSAVFLPMAFFGGSTGVIYRQFSLTIVSAMVLSVFVALILSPALTATLLKPKAENRHESPLARALPRVAAVLHGFQDWFNRTFERSVERYGNGVRHVADRKWRYLSLYALICVLLVVLFLRLPSGFLPNEDQGTVQVQFRLPSGATRERTEEVQREIEKYFMKAEHKNFESIFTTAGGGFGASGQNTGQGFFRLADWAVRPGRENTADAIAQRASAAFRGLRDAQVFALVPGAVRGLGMSSGFTMELQNTSGMSHEKFTEQRDRLLAAAMADSRLTAVRLSDLPDVSTLKIDVDTQRLTAFGINPSDVNATLSTAWGGSYVNDFIDQGRVKRVYVQGDAQFRSQPGDIGQWYVRSSNGTMAPFSAFAKSGWSTAPSTTSRFNGLATFEITGQAAPGVSSGTAMDVMESLANELPGTGVAWSGASYQERLSSGQAPILYALSLLVVFLCLAALYESWSVPVAVLLVIPLGLVGAIFAVTLRGLQNDVYLQIGLLTTMGLAAKNAILMIEFAEQAERQGMRVIDAALTAARIRLRPILMTSFAFIFGVLPLAIATGAGANSRVAIGTSVIGGMLTATLLAIFYIPLFFILVRRGVRDGLKAVHRHFEHGEDGTEGTEAKA